MYKKLFVTSLLFNIVLLVTCGVTLWKYKTREQRLIKKYQPEVAEIYREFGITPPAEPKALEDLYDPINKLMKDLAK